MTQTNNSRLDEFINIFKDKYPNCSLKEGEWQSPDGKLSGKCLRYQEGIEMIQHGVKFKMHFGFALFDEYVSAYIARDTHLIPFELKTVPERDYFCRMIEKNFRELWPELYSQLGS